MTSSFARQHARTRRFSLGVPRSATVAPDGRRVLFLRAAGSQDPTTGLWELDTTTGQERCVVDPSALDADDDQLPAAERARRERARELAGGVTSYATDRDVTLAVFTIGGQVHTVDLDSGTVVAHPTPGPAFDPRPTADGKRISVVVDDAVHLVELVAGRRAPGVTRPLVVEDGVSWGRAEFAAAEEMGRSRGHWWGPAGERLAVCRVDESQVRSWHLGDPATPEVDPPRLRYPAAGTANADVRLAILHVEGGRRIDVVWDREAFPYLARVGWGSGPLTLQVQSRDQRRSRVLVADPVSGRTEVVRETDDPAWVELVPGSPAWAGERLVTVEDVAGHGPGGSRALVVDGTVVSPPGLQVRSVVSADDDQVLVQANGDDPTQLHVWRWTPDGRVEAVTSGDGMHRATAAGAVRVVATTTLTSGPQVEVVVDGDGPPVRHPLRSLAEEPVVTPRVRMLELGDRALRGALLLPSDDDGQRPLPVLLDPYGGPHAQRVVQARDAFLTSQWFADQGFAVLVVDGRGSPGRGPAWERAIAGDLAGPVLADQLDALDAAAALEPRLDLERVGVRGWSYGGYVAALAVLRRPDRIRAAIAGAPVTDWRLYDTHYTERYLGHPDDHPDAYERSSLVDHRGRPLHAADPDDRSDLLLIHGLADDNVVAAHSVRLSAALLSSGHPHRFVPLSGVTHVAGQEDVAERLLHLQVDFLHRQLGTG